MNLVVATLLLGAIGVAWYFHSHPRRQPAPAPATRVEPEIRPPKAQLPSTMAPNPSKPYPPADGKWIFLSYSWGSKARVLRIKAALEAAGYRVWIDVDQITVDFTTRLAEALEGAAAVVVCVTEAYKHSKNCMREIHYAYDQRKLIVPIVLDEAQFSAENRTGPLWLLLAGKIWHDFSTEDKFEAAMKALLRDLPEAGTVDSRPADASAETGFPDPSPASEVRTDDVVTPKRWIMISYDWTHQHVALKLKKLLEVAGYEVWIDVENLTGDVDTAMAEAVDAADAVIVCISEKYKASMNCKREFQYADQQRKVVWRLNCSRCRL
eukprot:TRINITY_DN1054_c0_g1_i2.p1 TRINITY_DN1054_c0_g1~~TRINITY_DN1054_c0_g1_i2.p1  ORF type:complete len:338 (-),score=61.67 TRINITY_DN1054_c0_g1_i2:67-1035(-)